MAEHFVYLYRTPKGQPIYVGYGKSVQRALAHSGSSHNSDLKLWLTKNRFDLQVAGPYDSEREAKSVEAALISSLNPRFNKAPGDGPKFVPVGVPGLLWERPRLPELTLSEIGLISGGALLVYLAPGDVLQDGRKKFDAATPLDEDAVSNIEKYWDLQALIELWEEDPTSKPTVVLGLHGRVSHRFIVGALEIDRDRLCDSENQRTSKQWSRPRWHIPLRDKTKLDTHELRGRRVRDIRFGQFSHQLHIWVDGQGNRRH